MMMAEQQQQASPGSEFKPPLKPRRGLFYLFMGLFVLWLLGLVAMFVTTVYPHPEVDPHRRAGAVPVTSPAEK